MIHVLPEPGIDMSRHRFIEIASLHRLDGIHNLGASAAKSGSATKGRPGDGKPVDTGKGGLECIEIVCWFPFFSHDHYIHLNGVKGNSFNQAIAAAGLGDDCPTLKRGCGESENRRILGHHTYYRLTPLDSVNR